jgi:hypothetical protein
LAGAALEALAATLAVGAVAVALGAGAFGAGAGAAGVAGRFGVDFSARPKMPRRKPANFDFSNIDITF